MTGTDELTAEQVEAMTEERAAEVLADCVKAKRRELPEALARSRSKPHARLAKKALYQLRSVGVQVAAPPQLAQALPAPLPTQAAEPLCAMSSFLGTGERAIFFARPVRGGGLDLYQGILNDTRGVMELGRGESNRDTYRRRMKELERDPTLKVVLMPWSRMRSELGRALAMNERTGTALPKDADTLLHRLGVEREDPDAALPPPEPDDVGLAARSASLHQEKEISEWLPSEEHLRVFTARVDEVQASPLALSEAQKRDQLEQKVLLTAREAIAGETRKVYARRLWYMAELFERSQRPEPAKIARAEARRLHHGTEPSLFAEQLFRKVLALMPPKPEVSATSARPGALPPPGGLPPPGRLITP